MKKLLTLTLGLGITFSSYALSGQDVIVVCNANGNQQTTGLISDSSGTDKPAGTCGAAINQVISTGYQMVYAAITSTSNLTYYVFQQ